MKVVVIGAGISGLCAALELSRTESAPDSESAPEVQILEATGRAGGVISTFRSGGFIIERGPDSFFSDGETLDFLSSLDDCPRLEGTAESGRRVFLMDGGRMVALPDGFFIMAPRKILPFLASPLFSFYGKLRALAEIFIPARKEGGDESAASFVRRRFGGEILEKAAAPLIGGIYCSSPDILGAETVLREFVKMERERGSVLRSVLSGGADKSGGGARFGGFLSPEGGMSEIVDAVLRSLPAGCLTTDFRVSEIREKEGGGWEIISGSGGVVEADAVVVAAPCHAAARMFENTGGELADLLRSTRRSSCAVVSLAYETKSLPRIPDGFGVLFPRTSEGGVFACSFLSRKFPRSAPPGFSVLRFFMAGEGVCAEEDSEIISRARGKAKEAFGASAPPVMSVVGNYRAAMTVPRVGHGELVRRINEAAAELGKLAFAGPAFGGVGIADCIRSGRRAARVVLGRGG